MLQLWSALQARKASEEGATMVEYGIMVALIAVVSIVVITTIGTDLQASFTDVEQAITPAP